MWQSEDKNPFWKIEPRGSNGADTVVNQSGLCWFMLEKEWTNLGCFKPTKNDIKMYTVSMLFEPQESIFQNRFLSSDCHIKNA